jgi:hypothetical protein
MAASNQTGPTPTTRRRLRLGAVIAVALAVAVVAFLILRDGDSGNGGGGEGGPVAASAAELRALPTSVGHAVYWAGERAGTTQTYELSRLQNGRIYIRYLPAGVEIGVPRPDYLTVGTYPFRNAVRALRRAGQRDPAVTRSLEGGGVALANTPDAQNAYFAYPGENVQVEVFHPSPGRALQLIASGRIVPVS